MENGTEIPASGGGSTESELLQAIHELSGQVHELTQNLSENYPKKEEVTKEGRLRALKVLGFGVVLIVASNLITIYTISYCFLGTSTGGRHAICEYIPGYTRALDDGAVRLARFKLLIKQIEENRQNIKELDSRIDELESELNSPAP